MPNKRRHGIGFDGILFHGSTGIRVEVKIGWGRLTETEEKKERDCIFAKQPYWLLRWFEKAWVLESLGVAKDGTLKELLA